jgi:hypothetical protein
MPSSFEAIHTDVIGRPFVWDAARGEPQLFAELEVRAGRAEKPAVRSRDEHVKNEGDPNSSLRGVVWLT